MRRVLLLLFILFLLPLVSSLCNSGQIDINSASQVDLEQLDGIGPAKAQSIIGARPFDSVEDLVKVSRIKNATLAKIKTQGLACVGDGTQSTEEVGEVETVQEEAPINNTENQSADEVVEEESGSAISSKPEITISQPVKKSAAQASGESTINLNPALCNK